MSDKIEWREVCSWVADVPYSLVYDPRDPICVDAFPMPHSSAMPDAEELEALELAGLLAARKFAKKQ